MVLWTTSTKLFALDVTSEEPHHGGYAGVRLGEAQNPGPADHGGLALTRRVTQFQEAKTPLREEFRTCTWQIFQQRSTTTHTEPRQRCPIPGDVPNSGLVINELFYNVLSAAHTGKSDSGLMEHMSQVYGRKALTQESLTAQRV